MKERNKDFLEAMLYVINTIGFTAIAIVLIDLAIILHPESIQESYEFSFKMSITILIFFMLAVTSLTGAASSFKNYSKGRVMRKKWE